MLTGAAQIFLMLISRKAFGGCGYSSIVSLHYNNHTQNIGLICF